MILKKSGKKSGKTGKMGKSQGKGQGKYFACHDQYFSCTIMKKIKKILITVKKLLSYNCLSTIKSGKIICISLFVSFILAGTYPTGQCDPGYYCTNKSYTARPTTLLQGGGMCQPGTYCPSGSPVPIPCDAGKYCPDHGMDYSDRNCSAGYYCLTGRDGRYRVFLIFAETIHKYVRI